MAAMAELLAELAADGATVLFSSHQLDLVEELCEDVVIIDRGTDRPGRRPRPNCGPRSRSDSLTIRYRGADPDWSELDAIELVDVERRRGAPARRAAMPTWPRSSPPCAGRSELVSFAYEPPTLSELFRQAVAA